MTNRTHDDEHLRLLSVFHYVVAGLAALFSLFPVIYLVLGLAIVMGHLGGAQTNPPPSLFGWFFVVLAVEWILFGLSFATCLAFAGRFLRQRRRYLYCLVVAGFACLFAPFGTILGVLTIIVLIRPSVKAAFEQAPAPAGQPSTSAGDLLRG